MAEETYNSSHTGEKIDEAVSNILNGYIVVPSSTEGSSKTFRIGVYDDGTIFTEEMT